MEDLYNLEKKMDHLEAIKRMLERETVQKRTSTILGFEVEYNRLAKGELILNSENSVSAIKYYFKETKVEQLRWWVVDEKYPQYKYQNPNFMNFVLGSHKIFLSDHIEFYKDFIASLYIRKKDYSTNPQKSLALALQSFVLGDVAQAKILLGEHYKKSPNGGANNLIAALIYQDEGFLNKYLKNVRNYYEKQGALSPFRGYSEYATFAAKIAMHYGMQPDISDPTINKAMLNFEKIDFEDIDDIYKAYDIEPIKRYN
jgi:hypothetical protein